MLELTTFSPFNLVLIAALNPIVAVVGFLMGRHSNQWGKILLAGFAAALAGAIGIWFAVWTGLLVAKGVGGEAGVFVFSIFFGAIWATVGYLTRPASS